MVNVLVVDDDDAWRLTLKDWLGRKDVNVIGCSHGDWALTAIDTHRPDLVLLDVNLPGRNGLEVLQSVRHRWPALPVIMTTAFGGADVEESALRHGANAYIGKPFRMDRLLALVRHLAATPGGHERAGAP